MNEALYAILLIVVEMTFLSLTLRALRTAGMTQRAVSTLGVCFALWLGLALALLLSDSLSTAAVPQLPFAALVSAPIILGLLAQRYSQPFRTVVDTMSTEAFLSLQQMRLPFGMMFFLTDGLPLYFQLLGGLGDMAAGTGAFVALRHLRKDPSHERDSIIEGNLMGILDFAVVFPLALLVVIRNQPTALEDTFNLIPLVVVPVFILLHIFSLQKLSRFRQVRPTGTVSRTV